MGGRRLGRSEPAFRVASTTALPPPTSTARQRLANFIDWLFYCKACAGRIVRQLFTARPVPAGSSAGCLLQGLYRPFHLPAVFACNGPILPCLACPPLPCHACCPRSFCPCSILHFPLPLFITMCARIIAQAARTALLAAATRACIGGLCTGCDFSFSPCRVHRSWAME